MRARRGLSITITLGLTMCALAHADDDDPTSTVLNPQAAAEALAAAARSQDLTLYLEVAINGESSGKIVSFVERAGHLWAQQSDLRELGINVPASGVHVLADDALIDLTSMMGLHYRYIANQQRLELSVADSIRAPYKLGRTNPSTVNAHSGTGLVLNYDAYAQTDPSQWNEASVAISSEQRLFTPLGVLDNTEITTLQNGLTHSQRLATTYQYEDPTKLTTVDIGDDTTASLAWTRSVRFGGVQYRRDFTLAPDFVTFPLPQLGGSAAVPSTVDLYVNNVRQMSNDVPSGPFTINGVATITGGGVATLVVRDALGRQASTSLPIYVDSRLLAQGLSSYSVEAGFLRYNFGLESVDYEGNASFSGTYRYGVNNALTVETHGEATSGLFDGGGGALLSVGRFGVFRASVIGSTGPGRTGEQGSIGYQVVLPHISFTAQSTRAFSNYDDLAGVSGTPPPRYQDQLSISIPLQKERSIGASYVHVDDSVSGHSAIASTWYSTRINRAVSAYLNLSRDFVRPRTLTAYLGVAVDLGNRLSGFTNAGSENGHATFGASVYQAADYRGGWEWSAQANRSDGIYLGAARVGYLGQDGQIIGSVQDTDGHSNVSLEGIGGLVFMDGTVEPARRVGAGFALVSTDGIPGIPVMHENQLMGVTDSTGHLLVTDLNPYEHNSISIDSMSLPADASVPVNQVDIAPRGNSGLLAHFPIGHFTAATVTLVNDANQDLPVGSLVHVVESGRDFTVGYDGQAFIEDLKPHNHLLVTGPGFQCSAQFDYQRPRVDNGSLADLGSITCSLHGVHKL